jgi:hypothetical protein
VYNYALGFEFTNSIMNRRRFLKRSGAVAFFGTLAGCSVADPTNQQGETDATPSGTGGLERTESPPTLRERARIPAEVGDIFDRVLNVQELGADPDGEQPITHIVREQVADDTLLVFPEGRYRMGGINVKGVSNFGLVSLEGAQPTLVPTESAGNMGDWFIALQGENILLNGFDLDFTTPGHGARTQIIATAGDFWCGNLHVRGQIESSADAFGFVVLNPDGTGTVERLIARDGSPSDGGSTSGIFIGLKHAGKIHINDCEMWHFQGKGIYGSGPAERASGAGGGTIHVDGGRYKNNNPANIRLGGGSTIRNVTFRSEDTLEGESVTWERPLPTRHGIINARSVRVKGDKNGPVVIDNCDFYHEIGFGSGVITVTPTGSAVVHNCNIRVTGGDLPAIHLKPDRTNLQPCVFENVSISGDGHDIPIIRVRDRTGVQFLDCAVDGPNTNGFSLTSDSEISLLNTPIDVGKQVLQFDDSEIYDPHTIEFRNVDIDTPHEYQFVVTKGSHSLTDRIPDDGHVKGTLEGHLRSVYTFFGDITDLDVAQGIHVGIKG